MSVEYEFISASGNLTLTADNDLISHNPVRVHTGISDNRATFAYDESIIPYVKRQNRCNVTIDGSVVWTGYPVDLDINENQGTMTVTFDGIGKRLEETRPDYDSLGGSLNYSNIALDDAIDDYWSRTPFTNYTVTAQQTEIIIEDQQVHEANTTAEFESLFSPTDSDAVVAENDTYRPAQIAWTTDSDSFTTSGTGLISDPEFSGGDAEVLDSDGDTISISIDVEHTIPTDEFALYVRFTSGFPGENTNGPGIVVDFNGESWQPVADSAGFSGLEWLDIANNSFGTSELYSGAEVSPGTYTLTLTASGTGTDGQSIDVLAPLDNRFSVTLDNDNGGSSGYLDGPELYPGQVESISNTVGVSFNIVNSTVRSTIDDTSSNQRISVSNDGGATYTDFPNTTTVDFDYADAGREAKLKVRLGRYGTRTGVTPLTGHLAQTLSSISHTIDGDDLVVIDDLELSRNHFDNLKTLHDYGDFLWVIEHSADSISNMTVSSFNRGAETRPKPTEFDEPISINQQIVGGTYYNSIYLQGALVGGSRPTAEVKNQDAINEDDREISPGVLRDPDITTEAGADFRATALLSRAQDNNNVSGSITIPPVITNPGYARNTPLEQLSSDWGTNWGTNWGGGTEPRTVERISFSEGDNQTQATVDFVNPTEQLANDISELRRSARNIGDRV